jgi:hypothetical protein
VGPTGFLARELLPELDPVVAQVLGRLVVLGGDEDLGRLLGDLATRDVHADRIVQVHGRGWIHGKRVQTRKIC